MAACKLIRRDVNNQSVIESVIASNGAESKLFQEIKSILSDTKGQDALVHYMKPQTEEFKQVFTSNLIVDENNEPVIFYPTNPVKGFSFEMTRVPSGNKNEAVYLNNPVKANGLYSVNDISQVIGVFGDEKFYVDNLLQAENVSYQAASTSGITVSEKTIRDLAARMSHRIGIPVKFESDRSKEYKGKIENNIAYINLAYATLDTPIHEILGHPIIRAIKNKKLELLQYNEKFETQGEELGLDNKPSFEEIEKRKSQANSLNILYNNLVKELESGIGKEVLDRIKRDYVIKEKGRTIKDLSIMADGSRIENIYTEPDVAYSLEEQQEEAIVELLGLMTAEKLDNVKDGKLISLLKRLLKQMKQFVRSLINQKEIEIDKLPDNITLNDIASILAYSNSKLILLGYEVKYTTPDNNTFKTYQEASNHISNLIKDIKNVDLDSITEIKEQVFKPVTKIPEHVKNFTVQYYDKISYFNGAWRVFQDGDMYLPSDTEILKLYNEHLKENYKTVDDMNNNTEFGLKSFVEKNKEYEQSKEIIEEWKKVNNIQYNPDEVYSRNQEFVSVVGAYSSFDVNLMMQNILHHIEDNEKAGGKFAISAFTKPVDKTISHLEGGGGKIKFKIYPKSEDILWAANADVYSGSVWDASEKINKNKKSELLGVSYTKYPSSNSLKSVQPNLTDIIDKLAHHHNELGIVLTGNNFRFEYDEDIPYTTKKILDTVNSILNQKYGKLIKPKIRKYDDFELSKHFRNFYFNEDNYQTKYYNDDWDLGVEKYLKNGKEISTEEYWEFYDLYKKQNKPTRPTQTNGTLKESIANISNKHLIKEEESNEEQTFFSYEIGNYLYVKKIYEPDPFSFKEPVEFPDKFQYFKIDSSRGGDKKVLITKEEYEINKPVKVEKVIYTSQALINAKISALKEVAKKYPLSLIRSEVVNIGNSMQFNDTMFQNINPNELKLQNGELGQGVYLNGLEGQENDVKEGIDDLFNENSELRTIGSKEQYSEYLNTVYPNSKVPEILYFGSKTGVPKFEKFDNFESKEQVSFLSSDKNHAAVFGNPKAVIINMQNPFRDTRIVNGKEVDNFLNDSAGEWDYNKSISKNNDGIISKNIPDAGFRIDEYVVFNPDQIHVLGSENDIQGFKEFVNQNKYQQQSNANNQDLQQGIEWLQTVLPNTNIKLVQGLIDGVGRGAYNTVEDLIMASEQFADKGTIKHEAVHRALALLPEAEREAILNEASLRFGIPRGKNTVNVKYSQAQQNEINYMLKAVDILQSDKAKQVFVKGEKASWNLDKILTELAIPKEQKQLILGLGTMDREQLALELTANYNFAVEINTAKEKGYGIINEEGEYENDGSNLKQPTQHYVDLTVPGGTNYTEQEISTPLITPSIKGHAQFATDNGIGWFRSDDKLDNPTEKEFEDYDNIDVETKTQYKGDVSKTRRILEVQSDLFQKGRDKDDLIGISFRNKEKLVAQSISGKNYIHSLTVFNYKGDVYKRTVEEMWQYKNGKRISIEEYENAIKEFVENEYNKLIPTTKISNQFLQLLNKHNNWVTFFIKSIIQDSVKKSYEKLLFPTGNTASKVEGHTTLEKFKKQKEERIIVLQKEVTYLQNYKGKSVFDIVTNAGGGQSDKYVDTGFNTYFKNDKPIDKKEYDEAKLENIRRVRELDSKRPLAEIEQLNKELKDVEQNGFGALKPIWNFYENTITNILNKQFGKENVKQITDEYGNTWNEIDLSNPEVKKQTNIIKFQSPKLEYTGDLAIEEKIAEMAETSKDETIAKTPLKRFIQNIKNFFRDLFKERDNVSRFIRNINQGRYSNLSNLNKGNNFNLGNNYKQISTDIYNKLPSTVKAYYTKNILDNNYSLSNTAGLSTFTNEFKKAGYHSLSYGNNTVLFDENQIVKVDNIPSKKKRREKNFIDVNETLKQFNANIRQNIESLIENNTPLERVVGESLYDFLTEHNKRLLLKTGITKKTFTESFNKELSNKTKSKWFNKIMSFLKYLFFNNKISSIIDSVKYQKLDSYFDDHGSMLIYGITNKQKTKIPVINKLLYKTIVPATYNKEQLIKDAFTYLFNERGYENTISTISKASGMEAIDLKEIIKKEQYNRREDAWLLSNGLPQKHNTFLYKGRGFKNPEGDFIEDVNGIDIYDFVNPLFDKKTLTSYETKLKNKESFAGNDDTNYVMGFYNLGIGKDETGYYLEYSDVWDLNLSDTKNHKYLNSSYNIKNLITTIGQKVVNFTQKPFLVTGKIYKAMYYDDNNSPVIYYTSDLLSEDITVYNDFIAYVENPFDTFDEYEEATFNLNSIFDELQIIQPEGLPAIDLTKENNCK